MFQILNGGNLPEEATDNMFKQSCSLLFNKLSDHIAEYSSNSVKPFVRGTDIVEAMVIEQYLLHNEYCHCLAQLGASFHDSEAERNDFCCQQKVDNVR